MPFLNFFISFLHSFKSGVLKSGSNNIYNIYLDNPKSNIYFPFKKVKIINLDVVKEVCRNLNFLSSFLCLNRIVINYNILNCKLDINNFIIKIKGDNFSYTNEGKPILIKLSKNIHYFDFKLNEH